jgi:hypothetical protein
VFDSQPQVVVNGDGNLLLNLALKLSYIVDRSFLLHSPHTKQLASIRSTVGGQSHASQFHENEKTGEGLGRLVLGLGL